MYTAHAKVRMQQRAIPSSIVNLLLDVWREGIGRSMNQRKGDHS